MRKWAVVLLLLGSSAFAQSSPWRTYAGGYSTSWKTDGHHGHDQDGCGIYRVIGGLYTVPGGPFSPIMEPNCDGVDFARGNLDKLGILRGDLAGWRDGVAAAELAAQDGARTRLRRNA